MNKLNPNEGLKVFDIRWEADTAGPSPNNNKRIEVFLLGCDKAMNGNACKGCFNSITWDKNKAEWSLDPIELADMIYSRCDKNNKYITIGGGEPTDQLDKLIPFVKRLKEYDFHILMYTWRSLKDIITEQNEIAFSVYKDSISFNNLSKDFINNFKELLSNIDILIDGEFKQNECLYQQELGDGMLSSIGSGNQVIWDIKLTNDNKSTNVIPTYFGYRLDELAGLFIKPDSKDLVYITKLDWSEYNRYEIQNSN